MALRDRLHILVLRPATTEGYTSYGTGRGSPRPPAPIRDVHARKLRQEAEEAERLARERRGRTSREVGVLPTTEGMLLTFESWPGFELEPQKFDPGNQPPELIAVRTRRVGDQEIQLATVHVPEGALGFFLKRFDEYATRDTPTGNPRHAEMVERIAELRLATIEALWTDDPAAFPAADETIWWEVWLRRSDGQEPERIRAFGEVAGFEVGSRQLVFDNRVIVLVQATATQLSSALDIIDDLAELRGAHTNSAFFTQLSQIDQADWVADLAGRTTPAGNDAPSACILDTGVNRGHPLLEHSVAVEDLHACMPAWGVHDHDGHGTEMAGLALYGDLRLAFESHEQVTLLHRIESAKILPPIGGNEPDLYGAITAEAVARTEVQAAGRRRCFSMAITADPGGIAGTPSSWSAAVDALASGRAFDTLNGRLGYIDNASIESHRLFIISAGNVRQFDATYLDRCDVEPIEDPAQAWNALTVGAYTDLVDVEASGEDFAGWTPIAPPGDLSPFSRTSVAFQSQWPIKPEIIMEGGNAAASPAGTDFDTPDSLSVITTSHEPATRLLTTTNATSAATAEAAHMAAVISAQYPAFWPETTRGLMAHAARWTDPMKARFDAAGPGKQQREALARRYGYGVPTLDRCLRSATDALTLIIQDTIRPFQAGKLREMHVHDLPWPREALADLEEVPVQLRATLSYFIEPSPTRLGWKRRYRYASHQLRFELQQPTESNDEFRKRLNKRALDEEEERPTGGDDDGWFLGSRARNRGSLHSDIWDGTAADLAARGRVAVFPVTGWWKELQKRDKSSLGARYSLLLSIESPVEDVDLWTPVAQQVGMPITIET